jgi:C-terminal processing protease CtpA/Prc
MLTRLFLAVAATGLGSFAAPAGSADVPDSARVARLAVTGRLWSAIEIFHPWVPRRPAAWDSALVRAIPSIREARTDSAFAAAVNSMLASLQDPATRVMQSSDPWLPSPRDPDPRWRRLDDGVLLVRMNNRADLVDAGAQRRFEALAEALHEAKAVLLDLRTLSSRAVYPPEHQWTQSGIDQELVRERCQGPATRSRAHVGWRSPNSPHGSYGSYWRTADGLRYSPRSPGPPIRVVALVNQHSWVPGSIFALQAKGTAAIVSEGPFLDASIAPGTIIPLGSNLAAQMRTADVVAPDGGRPRADTTLAVPAPGDTAAALRVGIALARRGTPLPHASVPAADGTLPPARPAPEPYATMRSPELPWRLLAAYRIWSRIEYWAAYRHLLGEQWDRAFEEAIPSFEAANDSTAYALAVARFYKHMEDTHGFIDSPALGAWLGTTLPPVRIRSIEGVPVVTSFVDSAAARAAGFEVGDMILAVDGEEVAARITRVAGMTCVSNPRQRDYLAARRVLLGADSSIAIVRVRDARGRTVERRSLRSKKWTDAARSDRPGPVWKVLPGNLGYVDLERLGPGAVDSMFSALAATRGVVLDMRGYPQGTGWAIAPRLTERAGVVGATFRTPIATKPHTPGFRIDEQESFDQPLPPATGPRYLNPTVMLVDERTISQAEHTGLFFAAANGTTFVGSQTAGANGDITTFTIPGQIRLTFSGHDVRHADGRQLQQVGLPIAVEARPTIAGLRAGRDEVLEAGIRHLETRIADAKAKRQAAAR